ncbi:MBL fold metallo-hydrolase [Vibrio alfacsensis]|uniref:MBL fold metallo-hydrolase n=1 Tax=Vibrio alfacsensis TaxID=1074311 RepID=UPI004067C5AB
MTVERSAPEHTKSHATELSYPMASPSVGEPTLIVPGVYIVRMPMDLGLDHINIYLLEDFDGWYVVDTGLATPMVKKIWREIVDKWLVKKPLKGLICTHFHYDHASLAKWMMVTFDIPLYMSAGEYFLMRTLADSKKKRVNTHLKPFYRQQGVPESLIDNILSLIEMDPLSSLYAPNYCRVREGDVFQIGEREWHVLIGEGHSPEHVCLYNATDGLLIAGDQLLPEISSSVFVNEIEPQADPLRGWLASLTKLNGLPSDTMVLPAHGGVFFGLHQRTNAIYALHQRRLKQTLDVVQNNGTCHLYEIMRSLFTREMSAMNTMLALGETAAHVNYLQFEQKIEKQFSTDGGVITYRPFYAIDSLT